MATNRRDFLKSVVGATSVVSLSAALPEFLVRTAAAADKSEGDTVLVVLQLSGGNDGLNTIVPYADDAYGRSRKTLRLNTNELHKIDDHLGFHPAMAKASQLYHEGHLSILQGVGYPNSNRDHDAALRDWHTARPGEVTIQTGWLGRTIDSQRSAVLDGSVTGVCVAPIPLPLAMNGEMTVVPIVRSADQWLVDRDGIAGKATAKAEEEPSLLRYVQGTVSAAHISSDKVRAVLRDASGPVEYPSFQLAQQFQTVSELVRADLGIRIFFTELGGGGIGGFDNHANQRDNHAALLKEISESVAAFIADLKRHDFAERVLLMTFSEFGRTLGENGRRGTDHGAAGPVLLAGGKLRGGLVGSHPSLTDLDGDSPRFHTDFRSVYATVLDRWLGYDSKTVLGEKFNTVDFLG